MKISEKLYDVGVIIARFQTPELSEAHIDLLQSVADRHLKVIVILGLPAAISTRENPLDFEMRRQMIHEKFPKIIIGMVQDHLSNNIWSSNLDAAIIRLLAPTQSAVLYGGRDSFIPHYSGRFKTIEFEQEGFFSGTILRKRASVETRNSGDFRAGVVWGVWNRYPICFTTVDVAVFNGNKILLCKKEGEELLRFPGGFSEPESKSFESDARREIQEEAGIEISNPIYCGSFQIDDPRYKGTDRVKTLLFMADHVFGDAKAGDDIHSVKWVDFDVLRESDIEPLHRHLFTAIKGARR